MTIGTIESSHGLLISVGDGECLGIARLNGRSAGCFRSRTCKHQSMLIDRQVGCCGNARAVRVGSLGESEQVEAEAAAAYSRGSTLRFE